MNEKDIEKAWATLSMHNSELLLYVAQLEKQLRQQSIRAILMARLRNLMGKRYE